MDHNKEKARKYAEVMETELVSVSDYCEAMDNIMLAMGICYNSTDVPELRSLNLLVVSKKKH